MDAEYTYIEAQADAASAGIVPIEQLLSLVRMET